MKPPTPRNGPHATRNGKKRSRSTAECRVQLVSAHPDEQWSRRSLALNPAGLAGNRLIHLSSSPSLALAGGAAAPAPAEALCYTGSVWPGAAQGGDWPSQQDPARDECERPLQPAHQ